MKIFKNRISAVLSLLLALGAAAVMAGCSGGSADVSPSDVSGQADVSSQTESTEVPVDKALEIRVGDKTDDEVFLLRYVWNGEEFASEDSFQKIMMTRYMPEGNHAPTAAEDDVISFAFSKDVEAPSEIKLTQMGNTVRADTGLPYDTLEPELTDDGEGTYSFPIHFRGFKMYYYYLDCQWANGDELHCGFALEKEGSF